MSTVVERSAAGSKVFAIRQGALMLRVPHGERLTEELVGAVCDAVKADSRVHDFRRPPFRRHLVRTLLMYPYLEDVSDDVALRGTDHFHAGEMSDPIVFRLDVARENQDEFDGSRDFPSGDYYVAWDGVILVVLWEQSADKRVSKAAGRVVFDILVDACLRAGVQLYEQACEPSCRNRFTHKNVILAEQGTPGLVESYLGAEVITETSIPTDPLAAVRYWYAGIRYPFMLFAIYKNHAQRIRDLEDLISGRLNTLLDREQRWASYAELRWRQRLKLKRELRKATAAPEKLLSDIWLAIANVEVYRRSWDEERQRFKSAVDESGYAALFERDADDDAAIDSLDLGLARAGLDHFASRSDSRSMVVVTALVGVVGFLGAIVGAVLGAAIAA